MSEINILFLGGAKRVSLAEHFKASGEKMGFEVNIFSYELQEECPIASVGKVIIGKKWRDDTLIDDMMSAIAHYHIQIVLPFVDPAVEIAAKLARTCEKVFVPVSSEDICAVMFDKKKSEQWFLNHKIPIPLSYSAEDHFLFPVIIKPRKGSASQGIEVIHSQEEWNKIAQKDNYVIQRYIADKTEYTVDCYVSQKAEIISVVPRERMTVAGGEVMNSRTLKDDVLDRLSRKILEEGDFRGAVTIQFIRDNRTGETFVMEINPRLGGGVITSIEAGADIPTFILKEYAGYGIDTCIDWKEGTLMTRYYKEVVFYADNH